MKKDLYYFSHKILHFKFKWVFSIIIAFLLYFIFNLSYAENMGNCMNTPIGSTEILDPRHNLSQVGIQAENRALNTIVTDLRQEIIELKHQIILNNQISEEQNSLVQKLTTEQKETKQLIIDLQYKISTNKEAKELIQEQNYRCMR
jgi:hypothetical protein